MQLLESRNPQIPLEYAQYEYALTQNKVIGAVKKVRYSPLKNNPKTTVAIMLFKI